MSSASSTPTRRSFVITRISSGGAPVGKRFRNIDNQCPLVKSRNIAELQHLAMTRREGGFGLEPMLFKILLPHHALHSILSIQDQARSAVGIERGRRRSQLPEPASG